MKDVTSSARALRLPPEMLVTKGERVLAIVAIGFVVAVLADIAVRGW